MRTRRNSLGWYVIVLLTLGAAGFAVAPYVLFDPEYSRVQLDSSFKLHYPLLLVHIFSSLLALLLGWLQFLPGLRSRHSHFHRLIGKIYLSCVAIGGVTGFFVGFYTESYIRQMAFITLVVLWLYTGWKGYRTAREKRFEAHRVWMIRNYALTLVAASARIVTPVCILIFIVGHRSQMGEGVEAVLKQVHEVNIWLGLVLNLIITEWMIMKRIK